MTDDEIVENYLKSLEAFPGNTQKLFAIGFIGLPGTGKSTIARLLAELLGLPVSSNDHIRGYLNHIGFEGLSPRQDLMRDFAEKRTEWYYQHNTSVIVDANFTEQRLRSESLAGRYNARLILVETKCADETARQRINERKVGVDPHHSRGDILAYETALKQRTQYPPSNIFYSIETENDLAPQVEKFIRKLVDEELIRQ